MSHDQVLWCESGYRRPAEIGVNILQVITPLRFSGAERVCVEIASDLRQRGHRVEVATKPHPTLEAALAERGVPCHVARIGGKFNARAPFTIAELARQMQADLVHTHLSTASLWGSLAGRLLRIPAVAHVHALNTAAWFRWSTRLIAVAGAVKDHLIGQGIAAERIDVVHNAVSMSKTPVSSPDGVRAQLGMSPETPVVVVAAHLSRKKGHHVLLRALRIEMARRPGLRCLCLGDGPELPRLRAECDVLGLNGTVQFLGFRHDAQEVMRAADIVALPSVSGEGLPLCLLEAAALGKPMVASRLAGIPEVVVDGKTGFVVEPNSPEALAARIDVLLAGPSLRERMGAAACELSRSRFRSDTRAEGILAVYRRALDGR